MRRILLLLVTLSLPMMAQQVRLRAYVGSDESGAASVTEVIKQLGEHCPSVAATTEKANADYLLLVSDDGSGPARKGRAIVLSSADGTVLKTVKERSFKTAVGAVCPMMTTHR